MAKTTTTLSAKRRPALAALTVGALGVVFGDIGTSPLYALKTVYSLNGGVVRPTAPDVYGIVSLVFWAITLIVSVKYVALVMRADNDGEGGILALTALVQRATRGAVAHRALLVMLGAAGAALFYGDSVITPAISVLSAVEGLEVAAPDASHLAMPLALGILTVLFAVQRLGTAVVGRVFGPVMVLWFAAIAAVGAREVAAHPEIVRGLAPSYAVGFVVDHPAVAFVAMGAVMLAITGAEALYADMGHFGRPPIRRAWVWLVFPSLTLNYLGQSSLILRQPDAIESPFFLLLPHWSLIPMVVLATAATVIASQAVISGAFSLSRQAVQLGFLPRLAIRQTSQHTVGQIYVPAVNWALFLAVVAVVVGFGSSERLSSAYGVAVSGMFLITTVLFLAVARERWHWPTWRLATAAAVFLPIEATFLAANLGKIQHGGWLTLVIAGCVYALMTTWHRGSAIVNANRTRREGPLRAFVSELHAMDPPVPRVPGTAVFLNPSKETTPLALRANVEHNHVLHERVVILTVESRDVPRVADGDRVTIDDLGFDDDSIAHVTARFGFQEQPNVPLALRLADEKGLECDIDTDGPTYFISRIAIRIADASGMARWRKRLFAVGHNAADQVDYFGLPLERTIVMGSQIPL
ncbi:MAG: potassium transporter Kup [Actinomycetota bacterium]|nr:potassium transporter Kup [Actinomycetota bacterium]